MKIEFVSKNYVGSDRLEKIIESKLYSLEKFLPEETNVIVKLKAFGKEGEQMKNTMEISLQYKGQNIRSEVTTFSMWDNIDKIMPKLESQLTKIKDRKNSLTSKKRATEINLDDKINKIIDRDNVEEYGKVVKIKNFNISIISVDEAIENLELLDHNFYVFVNKEDTKISVLYKRLDGNYGLISPEI